jgi:N-acetylglucosamine kinase-like BadF-type ATPase
MADGRRPEGPLRQRLWWALDLDPADPGAPQAIKAQVVSPGFAPAGLARLAPVVESLAAEGDPEAIALLRPHAEALAGSVAGVARALALEAPSVAGLGGAITHLNSFREQFAQALARRLPAARLQAAGGDAVSGALAIARELLQATSGS